MSREINSLKSFHTFGIDATAYQIIIAETTEALSHAWHQSQKAELPFLLLGEGSNVLFLENYTGIVAINRLKGIEIAERADAWHLHVAAGENWHALVEHTLEKGLAGLENLALIPGCVGSAPIQNIGAYGVELNQVCEYVDILNLQSGEMSRIDAQNCQFGYRDSVFKHHYREGYAIVAVGLRLNKLWQPVMTYGELTKLNSATVTAREIFTSVCQMRRSKLPDPRVTGNAGSFFKNPLVSAELAAIIADKFPNMPRYPQDDGQVKLAAGWLIDQCELKGYRHGGAAVHLQQALVLINQDNATGHDIVALAHHVRQRVGEKFNVWLEPEVRFIASMGEQDAVEVIA